MRIRERWADFDYQYCMVVRHGQRRNAVAIGVRQQGDRPRFRYRMLGSILLNDWRKRVSGKPTHKYTKSKS